MKKLIIFLLAPMLGFAAAGDIKIDTKNSSDNAWISTIFAKQNNAVFGTSASGVPQLFTTTGSGTVVALSAGPTFTGTVAGASLQLSSLTSGRVTFAGTAGLLSDSSGLTYNTGTSTLTTTTFSGALSGNATTATTATTATNATNTAITDDASTNASVYPTWVTSTTGNLPQKITSTKFSFNPSTGILTLTASANGSIVQINNVSQNGGIQLSRTGTNAGNTLWQVTSSGGSQLTADSDISLGSTSVGNAFAVIAQSAVANTLYVRGGGVVVGSATTPHAGALLNTGGLGWGVTSTATAAGTTVLSGTSTSVQVFTGSTTQSITMPLANIRGTGFGCVFVIKNRSSGSLTVNRAGSDTIDGGTSDTITTGVSKTYISNGSTEWTIN